MSADPRSNPARPRVPRPRKHFTGLGSVRGRTGWGLAVLLVVLAVLDGCASQQGCVTPVGASGLTPESVASLGQGEGAVVTWGGVIADTRNLPEVTEIETIGYRLDRCGKPTASGQPIGRFIARQAGFLEPSDYRAGRRISVTGRIAGVRDGQVGEASYRFPILENAVVRLWPDEAADDQRGWTPRLTPYLGIGFGSGGFGGIGGGIGLGF
ncbi:Slp family lipoprotein [Thiocapsa marina]|uniref:Outer membrane lipoprotein Slp n=1 Tax=Thiocapsa marina 5811 TaxID=768671 RepID=F9UDE9_9GAMM|nr:Slp family lipoprotein [Thiocapsa marina]EGV17893.1 outer membrane lipoprotein Slp [Thiocapsa marina 5811]